MVHALENRGTRVIDTTALRFCRFVGASLAPERNTCNPVDPDRVDRLMDAVRTLR